jgi:glucose-6-phosphate 1-epimerase
MQIIDKGLLKLSTQGAHIFHWQPPQCEIPVLFCSEKALFEQGKSIRGGVPICWPWFGPKDGMPQHGFARTSEWKVIIDKLVGNDTHIILELTSDEQTKAIFPFDFKLVYEITAGETLALMLTTYNTGDTPIEISQALHSYFQVGDISAMQILGLDGLSFIDKVNNESTNIQEGDITIASEVDRIYITEDNVILIDAQNDREISIETFGATTQVIWNPWIEKSIVMTDLKNDDYLHFVCIEPANADKNIIIKPGEEYTIGMTVYC